MKQKSDSGHGKRLVLCVAAVAAIAFACLAAQPPEAARAKGFKLPTEYYPATNGVQRPKAMITGKDARLITNGVWFVTNPRIESFREDGSLESVAQSIDGVVDLFTHDASGTNIAIFRPADTNLYVTGRGFLWLHSNSVFILSNNTYTWVNRSGTNSPVKP